MLDIGQWFDQGDRVFLLDTNLVKVRIKFKLLLDFTLGVQYLSEIIRLNHTCVS